MELSYCHVENWCMPDILEEFKDDIIVMFGAHVHRMAIKAPYKKDPELKYKGMKNLSCQNFKNLTSSKEP